MSLPSTTGPISPSELTAVGAGARVGMTGQVGLECVVGAPEGPHAAHVVRADVAVEIVARSLLAARRPGFVLQREALGGCDAASPGG